MSQVAFKNGRSKAQVYSKKPVLLWLRQDLRLKDHPALTEACKNNSVIPVYILDNESPGPNAMGGASLWWLHHSLKALNESLIAKGSQLVLRKGNTVLELKKLLKETKASAIHAIRHYEPWWIKAEEDIQKDHNLILYDGNQLAPPGTILTSSNKPFKIFTPFWRALLRHMPPERPFDAPESIPAPEHWPQSDDLDNWNLLPTNPNWATGFRDWTPGEDGALMRLDIFHKRVADYEKRRDFPSLDGTSRLSPHLHFGEVSPNRIWHKVADKSSSVHVYLSEVAWRDFAQNLLLLYPEMKHQNQKEQFNGLPWRTGSDADADLKAWQKGKTGYPIVDAGMRQLWETGWMHNRVRMIAASFLVKHLLIDWRRGEKWFWDCLVDADYGSNSTGWQWIAGSGVDSNMWSRVMAPLTQSSKFNAAEYIRTYVPELASLSDEDIHDPDGVGKRPENYPVQLIGHKEGRQRALDAYEHIRKS